MTGEVAKNEVNNKKGGGMLRMLKNNCNFAPQKYGHISPLRNRGV